MKIRIAVLIFSMFSVGCLSQLNAQIAKSEYFMKTSYMRTGLNPALRPDKAQLVVPILPNIGANIQTNTINLDNLTFRRNGERVTFIHPTVSDHDFLKNISKDNYIRADVNYKLFGIGFYTKDRYTAIDINVRAHADVNIPKSLFSLLKVGFEQDEDTHYNLRNISATAQAFVELGVSQSRVFLDNTLTIGARAKMLFGVGYADLNAKQLDISAGPMEWRSKSLVSLRGAAPGVKAKFNNKDQLKSFGFDWDGIPGYGAGIDLGASYEIGRVLPILNGFKVSAALNDIGFITWSKGNSLNMQSSGKEIIVDPNSTAVDDRSLKEILDDALDDLQEAVDLIDLGRKGSTTALRMSMLLGVEYELIKNKLSLGTLYSARFGNYYTAHELTVSGNYEPLYWLAMSGSYSFVHSNFDTFGFALHLAPKKGITFCVASDYIIPHVSTQFIPTSSKGLNLQLGFSIPIGKSAPNQGI